ncbi:hypothetical protein BKA70DRAFT_1555228 [Coprinopsis sp. MPI-PUGE-AT-0042]|nr:hypothetical protein BKA70DRAFT_1555228 [Coprinopsis sp. MPI-PUGE-AT-0042]
MNDFNDERSTEDHPLDYHTELKDAHLTDSNRPQLRSRRATSTIFHKCKTLELNNCSFIFSGRDYHRYGVDVPPEQLLPFPISAPTPPPITNHYRIATMVIVSSGLLILMGYWIA